MHGRAGTQPPNNVSFRGDVWTDGRGQATVSLPRDAFPPHARLEYELQAIEADTAARVTSELRDGRFTIATDEPHVKVAWRISHRKEESK